MKYAIVSTALALALAGCGAGGDNAEADADGDGKISVEEAAAVAEREGDVVKLEPGQYKGTTELVSLEIPDAPPEAKKMLEAMLGGEPQEVEFCLTEDEAEQGFEKMAKEAQGEDCSFEKFELSGGSIDAVMNCKVEGQGTAKVAMQGSGTSTSSDMTMTMDAKGPGGETMKMKLKTSQKRVGDCDA